MPSESGRVPKDLVAAAEQIFQDAPLDQSARHSEVDRPQVVQDLLDELPAPKVGPRTGLTREGLLQAIQSRRQSHSQAVRLARVRSGIPSTRDLY